MINLSQLILHPEMMSKETLYNLRSLVALHPYYQTARLLLLQNLYLLHDPSFDEELRNAAVYITDRRVIFNLVEAGHYSLKKNEKLSADTAQGERKTESRSIALIDNFLESLPEKEETEKRIKPTPADATIDYVAYLIESEEKEKSKDPAPQMKGQTLIDDFINKKGGKIELRSSPEHIPDLEEETANGEEDNSSEGFFTETLARIYIKQGRYSKALEIIKRLNLIYPKKNAYFADQIRFLEKLIINSQNK